MVVHKTKTYIMACCCIFLYGGNGCWTGAQTTTKENDTAVEAADNTTSDDQVNQYVNSATEGMWQITETANESETEPEGLFLRSSWTAKSKVAETETLEGWLNSGIITNDVHIPYRGISLWNRLGNESEEWKGHLAKPDTYGDHHNDKVSRFPFNDRRPHPFQFHWQRGPNRMAAPPRNT